MTRGGGECKTRIGLDGWEELSRGFEHGEFGIARGEVGIAVGRGGAGVMGLEDGVGAGRMS